MFFLYYIVDQYSIQAKLLTVLLNNLIKISINKFPDLSTDSKKIGPK